MVVEATPNGESGDWLREADLEHHLNNDKDESAGKETGKRSVKKAKPLKEGAEDEAFKPIEFASKDDYQMNQAMNLLKLLATQQGGQGQEGQMMPIFSNNKNPDGNHF